MFRSTKYLSMKLRKLLIAVPHNNTRLQTNILKSDSRLNMHKSVSVSNKITAMLCCGAIQLRLLCLIIERVYNCKRLCHRAATENLLDAVILYNLIYLLRKGSKATAVVLAKSSNHFTAD